MANIIWEDTSEVLILNELDTNTDYLISTSSFLPNTVFEIARYLPDDELVERFDLSIISNAIFNVKNKSDDYRYFPEFNQENPDDPIAVSNAILTNLEGMERLNNVLAINGTYPVTADQMMISRPIVQRMENLMNIDIYPGAKIDISIAKRFPFTDVGEDRLSHFEMNKYQNITISGIFELNGAVSLTTSLYTELIFNNLVIFPIAEMNFTPGDLQRMDNNSLVANLMIIIREEQLISTGIARLRDFVFTFLERIKSRFWFSIGDTQLDTIEALQKEFSFSFNSAYLYFPLVLLAIMLSHYTISLLINGREEHFRMLKLRGSTDIDIIRLLITEFLITFVCAFVLGMPFSIIFATLIPGLRPNGSIDFDVTSSFFNELQIDLTALYQVSIVVLTLLLLSASYHIFSFISQTKAQENTFYTQFAHYGRMALTLLFSISMVLLILDLRDNLSLNATKFDSTIGVRLSQAIVVMCVLWLLYSQVLADVLFFVMKYLHQFYVRIIPRSGFFIHKNILRKNSLTKVLAFYMIFLFSMLIFATTLYSSYDVYNQESEEYLMGADLRIHTQDTSYEYYKNLTDVPGIEMVSPIYRSPGYIASTEYTVYAVDPLSYLEVGYWDYIDQADQYRQYMNTLLKNETGMIISDKMSRRLGLGIGEQILLSSFEGAYVTPFSVVGIMESAPGLGLAAHSNPEVNQANTGWVIISLPFANSTYALDDVNLFLASLEPNYQVEDIRLNLEDKAEVIIVNPDPVNQNFIGVFIGRFLPFPRAILLFTAIITMIISIVMISLITNYLLNSRKKEYALMMAMGGHKKAVYDIIMGEIMIVSSLAILLGIIFGLGISQLSLYFFVPFTLKKILVPITLQFNAVLVLLIVVLWLLEVFIVISVNRSRILADNISGILLDRR